MIYAVASGDPWTVEELAAAVEVYLRMLVRERAGLDYSKTEFRNEALAGPLAARSRGSYELRMQNISAVLQAHGREHLSGYPPRSHVGPRIQQVLEGLLGLSKAPEEP